MRFAALVGIVMRSQELLLHHSDRVSPVKILDRTWLVGKSEPRIERLVITATVFSPPLEEMVRDRMRITSARVTRQFMKVPHE